MTAHSGRTTMVAAVIVAAVIVVGSGIYTWTNTGGDSGQRGDATGPGALATTAPTAAKEINHFPVARLSATQTGGVCAVLATGRGYCWGPDVKSPTPKPVQMEPVEQISIGYVTCVVSRGELWCWQNSGDSTPRKKDGVVGATAVATSVTTICAIAVGDVYCIGSNTHGSVGDGTHEDRDAPTKVDGPSGTTALALNMSTACAVGGGDLWCWGDNTFGQLGDGTRPDPPGRMVDRPTAAKVVGLGHVTAVSIGGGRTCAISDGDLFCWGRMMLELSIDSATPVAVPSFGKVTSVSVGQESVCAIRVDGAVVCGGDNRYGRLGTETSPRKDDVVVVRGISGATSVAVGIRSACAATEQATYCWGNNEGGQLGDGTTAAHKAPAPVRWPN
ncbi:RCC1 domain-containing protein [Mycobacteroides abscessus]|uniref:RCC1 domain-containing protein n=2 Tax=Mycobacteroides abscessus TaxID=36809 RepID=UPI0009A72756